MKPAGRPNAEADPFYTLSELRRTFFAPGCAPTKRILKDWILKGRRGVYLDAVLLDDRYFVRESAFERFIGASKAHVAAPRKRFPRSIETALDKCVALGVKLDRR